MPCTEQTTLDLVVNKRGAHSRAPLPKRREPLDLSGQNTALALDRLDNDTRHILGHERLELGHIIQGADTYIADQGQERRLVLGIGCHRQGAHRASVERMLKAHQSRALGRFAREFEGRLVGLRATVGNKRPHILARCSRWRLGRQAKTAMLARHGRKTVGQLAAPGIVVQITAVHQLRGLLCSDSGDLRISMPKGIHGNATREVEVAPRLGLPRHGGKQVESTTVGKDDRGPNVRAERRFAVPVHGIIQFHRRL